MGSYVNLVFSDARQVEDIHPHLALAAQLAPALEGCEKWWMTVEIALQRMNAMQGMSRPFGLMVRATSATPT